MPVVSTTTANRFSIVSTDSGSVVDAAAPEGAGPESEASLWP